MKTLKIIKDGEAITVIINKTAKGYWYVTEKTTGKRFTRTNFGRQWEAVRVAKEYVRQYGATTLVELLNK